MSISHPSRNTNRLDMGRDLNTTCQFSTDRNHNAQPPAPGIIMAMWLLR